MSLRIPGPLLRSLQLRAFSRLRAFVSPAGAVRAREGWRQRDDAERMRVYCCCRCVCGWDAAGNGIVAVVYNRVADALYRGLSARITAARCRLALAKGLSSRLCEQSVLEDCPIECISNCGSFCSAKLVLRFSMAQPIEANEDTKKD